MAEKREFHPSNRHSSSLLCGPYTPLHTTLHHMRIATKAATTMRFGSTLILLQSFVGGGYSFTVDLPPSISGSSHHTKSTSSAINYADNSDLDSVLPLPPLDEIIKQQRPVRRRSFLHQLDRFLTDLQGEISFLHFAYYLLYAAITFIHLHGWHSLGTSYHYLGTQYHLRNHTFLSGNFAPVREEHVAVPVQVMEGEIPGALYGSFCRNGPNPLFCTKTQKKRYHWFDGRKYY